MIRSKGEAGTGNVAKAVRRFKALYGDVEEHREAFRRAAEELGLSLDVVYIKKPAQLKEVDVLTIPGGESTTIGILAKRAGLLEPLRDAVKSGLPTLGTCAGAVLMSSDMVDAVAGRTDQPLLGVLDAAVVRNAFGRQRESFEADLQLEGFGRVRAVFIRAPAFVKTWGDAKPLGPLPHGRYGTAFPAAVVQRHIVATAFHPELSTTAFHRFLLELARK